MIKSVSESTLMPSFARLPRERLDVVLEQLFPPRLQQPGPRSSDNKHANHLVLYLILFRKGAGHDIAFDWFCDLQESSGGIR